MKILITGVAGFIGHHLVNEIASNADFQVIGLDNLNNYYDVQLKHDRLKENGIYNKEILYNKIYKSEKFENFSFLKLDLLEKEKLMKLFEENNFCYVINLAAQAGVRYSLVNPYAYIESNIIGFHNIIECSKIYNIKRLFYASTSSVYGLNKKIPFSEEDKTENPISLYAATKKTNELIAHSYANNFNLPSTGLRFFTVYGPWGRPDMALFLFTESIYKRKAIKLYNYGNMERDFTYVKDIVKAIKKLLEYEINIENNSKKLNYELYNIGNNKPTSLITFVNILEKEIGIESLREYLPLQPGDFITSHADSSKLYSKIGFLPKTDIVTGIHEFVKWYKQYHKL